MLARFWSSSRNRLALLLLLSLALHLALLRFSSFSLPSLPTEGARLEARLVPLPEADVPPVRPPPSPPPPTPHPRPRPKPRVKPQLTPPPMPANDAAPAAPAPPELVQAATGTPSLAEPPDAAPATGGEASGAGQPASAGAPDTTSAAPPAPPRLKGTPPESATLYYDVVGKDPRRDANQSYVGNGTLVWKLGDAASYQADLDATASLLFLRFTVLQSHSEGELDANGLKPSRYTETPRNRAALVTLFRRGQESVGVHTGGIEAPPSGTQDRLSILFQLGALLLANPGLSEAGAQFDVSVANLKGDAAPWTFRVAGLEPVTSGIGRIDAVHVQRVLRPGTNDRRIDVWIALDLGGYPARILYTEPSEAYVDLTLTKIE